ncbi:MAG: aminofutalosine synthase MqnE, partial [Candidatus Desulforudis sp.]|nr:aminofutalosine synthase MqnE [Desulforudis sp.]
MDQLMVPSNLADIADKVIRGDRLSADDGIRLFESDDLLALGHLSDLVRQRKHGDRVYFVVNR